MQKTKMRKWILLAVTLVIAMAVTSCTKPGGQGSSSLPSTAESLTTDWYYQMNTAPTDITCFYRGRLWDGVIDEGDGWEESSVYNKIKEDTGVSFHYDVPPAAELEILGTMIASGTYPDMITFSLSGYTAPYIKQMKDAGLIYSITELSNAYAPTLFDRKLVTDSMRSLYEEDGVLWSYIGFECGDDAIKAYKDIGFAPTSGYNILYVRKDILAAYGKTDIKTWEDYNNFLVFAQKNYSDVYAIQPSVDGWIFDVVGRHFLSKFGSHLSRTYVDTKDQKLEYILKDEHCKNYVKWLNTLYREGVLTDTLLSVSGDGNQQNLYAGKYAAIISSTFSASNSVNSTLIANGKADQIYVPISNVLVDDSLGFQVEVSKDKGQMATVITKNCKNPDRAIRLLEYFLTDEGQATGMLGVEGETWEWQGDKRVLKSEPAALISSNLLAYVQKYKVLGCFSQFALNKNWAYYCDDYLTPKGELRDLHNTQLGPYMTEIWNYGFVEITDSFEAGSDAEITNTRIKEALFNGIAKVIAASSDEDFENKYNGLIEELESLGLAQIEQIYTDEYLKNCEKLGIKPFETLSAKVGMD